MSAASGTLLALLTALGWVVVLPLGLRTLGPAVVPSPRSLAWPVAGAFGALSVLAPTGWAAVALALPAAAGTAVLAVVGARHGVRAVAGAGGTGVVRTSGPDLAIAVGLVFPAVGATALVAERGGWSLLGFSAGYLALTVPHMLFAGFGACLVAGLLAREAARSRLAAVGAWGVPAGVALVLVGYFVSDAAELAGAVVLTAALWLALWCGAGAAGPAAARGGARRVRTLRLTAALAGTAGMLLALWWAVGEAFDVPHPGIGWMLATHGVANALGVVLCSLLALRPAAPGQAAAPAQAAAPGPAPRAAVVPPFTYAEVGATARTDLPPGYAHLRARHRLGPGTADDLARVGEALLTWRVHAAARVRLATSAAVAAPGVRVTTLLGVGELRLVEPCEVIWTERTDARVAFGYGTLPGHVFVGEEAFVIERDADGLWFTAVAFSRPAVWWTRALRLAVPLFQHAYLAWLARGARAVLRETEAAARR
ncbi:YndJ family transporter [Antribacter gilvus]|uniref:YndJ family transporter n=1 Tax=Antribacter gilvus TaxID=2304675 RepID=UPI0019816A6F|nr:YndJ family transporter [Antribacter gilvus]